MTVIAEKMKKDVHIQKAIQKKRKHACKRLSFFSAVAVAAAVSLCFVAKLGLLGWLVTLLGTALVIALSFCFLVKRAGEARIFWGKITQIEVDREIVPRKGSGAVFGTSHKYLLDEVYELLIALQNERGETQVIVCPPQYEKILSRGDTLLCHSLLPYPAHLSNPTKCICMHCGTMQASENTTCITCAAEMYNIFTAR